MENDAGVVALATQLLYTHGMSSQGGSSLVDSDGDSDCDSDNAAATTERVVTAKETATLAVMVMATVTALKRLNVTRLNNSGNWCDWKASKRLADAVPMLKCWR